MSQNNFSINIFHGSVRQEMIEKKTWSQNSPVSLDRLGL